MNGDCNNNESNTSNRTDATTPICRCRVMYLGSAVPHFTKDGLQGIQEPLRQLYPDQASLVSGQAGIDSWLSVWSNGILLENIDDNGREMKRFFQIDSLHYCAAVRYVVMSAGASRTSQSSSSSLYDRTASMYQGQNGANNNNGDSGEDNPSEIYQSLNSGNQQTNKSVISDQYNDSRVAKFLPLDSPYSRNADPNHPPVFACILRRTVGIKVLECHAFVCKREAPANALVRCCFHAYADTMYAKQIGADIASLSGSTQNESSKSRANRDHDRQSLAPSIKSRSKSTTDLVNQQQQQQQQQLLQQQNGKSRRSRSSNQREDQDPSDYHNINSSSSRRGSHQNDPRNRAHNNNNHQMSYGADYAEPPSTRSSRRVSDNPRLVQKFSKSMHHLDTVDGMSDMVNGAPNDYYQLQQGGNNQSLSCVDIADHWRQTNGQVPPPLPPPVVGVPPPQLAGRMLPPHPSVISNVSRGGTLKSIRSLAANSIASTLLRGKIHAKTMKSGSTTSTAIPMMMGPNGPIPIMPYGGSQTMRLPSRKSTIPTILNADFTPLDAKQMKKLVKKSAKLGLDPSAFVHTISGPPSMAPPPIPAHMMNNGTLQYAQDSMGRYGRSPDSMIPPDGSIMTPNNGYHSLPPFLAPPDQMMAKGGTMPTLVPVQPSEEFCKSKAGKKWLKQQKELRKCLPPHLEGLPIVFGAPPPGIELVGPPLNVPSDQMFNNNNNNRRSDMTPGACLGMPPVPPMDDSGYYNNPHPFYGMPNGMDRPSAATTLARCSPSAATGAIPGQYYVDEVGNIMTSNGDRISMSRAGDSLRIRNDGQYVHQSSSDNGYDHHNVQQAPPRHRILPGPLLPTPGQRNSHPIDAYTHRETIANGSVCNKTSRSHHKSSRSRPSSIGPNGSRRSSAQLEQSDAPIVYNGVSNDNSNGSQYDSGNQHASQSSPDDNNSYHSGIYKKGHLNERAFSYSIRQESTRDEGMEYSPNDGSQAPMPRVPTRHQPPYDVPHASMPMDELSIRLQQQMNLKSSKSKSKSRERV